MTTATLVARVIVNLATTVNHENHAINAIANHENSENLRHLESSESLLRPESTVNRQQPESIASHLHLEDHLHLGW